MKELRVGDKVLIKSKYDPGCDGGNYNGYFLEFMLTRYGGKKAIIIEKYFREKPETSSHPKIPDDNFTYKLDIDHGDYFWRSSMFDFGLYARIFHR